jgi:hypothetical protein
VSRRGRGEIEQEPIDRDAFSLKLDRHAGGIVSYESLEIEGAREAIDEWPKADALNRSSDVDPYTSFRWPRQDTHPHPVGRAPRHVQEACSLDDRVAQRRSRVTIQVVDDPILSFIMTDQSSDRARLARRDFVRELTGILAMGGAGLHIPLSTPDSAVDASGRASTETFVGIQMGPHTMLDEGIEHTLDLIQDKAAVNVVMPYSHGYNGAFVKPLKSRASHGVLLTDNTGRKFPLVWVKTHDRYYTHTTLRHQVVDATFEHHDRDLFHEMAEPARKRGMKIYARVLEAGGRTIANFSKVVTRDIDDRPTRTACWNHPEYIGFWTDTMEDLFRSYDLDGIQWGAERQGPLMNVVSPWDSRAPTCFCEFCVARGKAKGIDPERARQGFRDLYNLAQGHGDTRHADGVFASYLRVIMRYPEILSWEYQYRLSREEICASMYKRVKEIKPTAEVGWHVDQQPSSWDMVYRAEMSYEEMAPHSDFIKPIVYHSVLGPRIRDWYLPRFKKTFLSEISLETSLELYYDLFGYDENKEPKLDDLARKGFSPEYVYREIRRSVASANGKTKIYAGVGFDVPGSPADTPETVYQATRKAFEAGASGVVASREYEEMKVEHLAAFGRAVREG